MVALSVRKIARFSRYVQIMECFKMKEKQTKCGAVYPNLSLHDRNIQCESNQTNDNINRLFLFAT